MSHGAVAEVWLRGDGSCVRTSGTGANGLGVRVRGSDGSRRDLLAQGELRGRGRGSVHASEWLVTKRKNRYVFLVLVLLFKLFLMKLMTVLFKMHTTVRSHAAGHEISPQLTHCSVLFLHSRQIAPE